MSGVLLPQVFLRALDANGKPLSGAKLFSYLTGTGTPTPTYTDATLGTPRTNPIVADAGGLFAPIFLDPTVTYRFVLTDSSNNQIGNAMDPVSGAPNIANGSITGAMLAGGAAAANLGFTPMNEAGDTATGELIIGYALSAPPNPTSIGFRGMPLTVKNANYTFAPDDSGRLFLHDDGFVAAWTIPPDSAVGFAFGTVIGVRNAAGGGVITLTRGSGVALTIAGAGTNQDVALAGSGFASLVKEGANTWFVGGTGLS